MAKKSRRNRDRKKPEPMSPEVRELAYGLMTVEKREKPEVNEVPAQFSGSGETGPTEPMEPALHTRLELMKQGAAKTRAEVAETIAQLEEWRAEIDGTIAYLRGTK